VARGIQSVGTCVPDCARGARGSYPVEVVLWGGAPAARHPGEQRYTTITLLYPGVRPSVPSGRRWVPVADSATWPLWG